MEGILGIYIVTLAKSLLYLRIDTDPINNYVVIMTVSRHDAIGKYYYVTFC